MNNVTIKAIKKTSLKTVFIIFCATCVSNTAVAMENLSPVSTSTTTTTEDGSALKVLCKLAPQLCL